MGILDLTQENGGDSIGLAKNRIIAWNLQLYIQALRLIFNIQLESWWASHDLTAYGYELLPYSS